MTEIDALVAKIPLGREHQKRALHAALTALLGRSQRGIVLADEVGCGKTYEALAVTSLLWSHFKETDAPIRRILILANNALIQKWFDELETSPDPKGGTRGQQRGFQQYVTDPEWEPLVAMMRNVIQLRHHGDGAERGIREGGRIQVRPDRIYLVRPDVLTRGSDAEASTTVRWLMRSSWDVVLVDEAHHFSRLHTKASRIFFPDGKAESRSQGLSARFILALTATPFQLKIAEVVNLLRLIEAPANDLEAIADGLARYESGLRRFYGRRRLSPQDPMRMRVVQQLGALRLEDGSGGERPGASGLQPLLRRYLLRNVKEAGQRAYAIVERRAEQVDCRAFDKLADLQSLVRQSSLIPFDGPDRWIYLNVRDLVADAIHEGTKDSSRRTFVAGDLRQMLSSYEQLYESTLVQREDLPHARKVRQLLRDARDREHQHPKVRALCDLVGSILDQELAAMRSSPSRWFSKILIFNTMLQTARTLRESLERVVEARVEAFVDDCLAQAGFRNRAHAEGLIRDAIEEERETIRTRLREKFAAAHLLLEQKHVKGTGIEFEGETREIVDVMFDRLLKHTTQPLFLLRLVRWCLAMENPAELDSVRDFLMLRVSERLAFALDRIVDYYLDDTPLQGEAWSDENIERARRELARLARILAAPQYVGRFDGDTDEADRELRRENFNRPYAPLVLLVSAVGEEGIDLQQHTRFVLHYDVEWNPAKMEQREGRVDREGRRGAGQGPVQVNFFLLKDTYEERIFHTVMQRDAWFQIMIGSKRQELARDLKTESDERDESGDEAELDDRSNLTAEERAAVMLDLRP